MSALSQIIDPIKSLWHSLRERLRSTLLGANNERLDFLIDSFHKLQPSQQKVVIGGGIVLIAGVLVVTLLGYFSRVHSLRQDLASSIGAVRDISNFSAELSAESQKFQYVIKDIRQKTGGQTSLKSFFEKISRDEDITIGTLNEKVVPLPQANLLSDHISEVQVDITLNNISLPKLLKYMSAVEKSNKHLHVTHLSIRSRYETKLYFDSKISVRGYQMNSNSAQTSSLP